MVDWFGIGALRNRVEGSEKSLSEALEKIRSDHVHFSRWINHLHHENRTLHFHLQAQRKQVGLNEEQVRTLVEKHAAFDIILARIRGIEDKVSGLAQRQLPAHDLEHVEHKLVSSVSHRLETHLQQSLQESRNELQSRLDMSNSEVLNQLRLIADRVGKLEEHPVQVVQEQAFSQLQQKLLKRIAKHPKPVVKSAILTLVQKYGRIQGTELREMVVEEQQLCSKSSFYRLLEELEKEGAIDVLGDGKEKTYADAIGIKNRA
jgi:hypothetical protein